MHKFSDEKMKKERPETVFHLKNRFRRVKNRVFGEKLVSNVDNCPKTEELLGSLKFSLVEGERS